MVNRNTLFQSKIKKMCLNDSGLECLSKEKLTKRQKNLCNEQLAINRDIVCSVLASCLHCSEKPIKCLEGIGICGINGMLWKKYFGENVDVTINGVLEEDFTIINQNVTTNSVRAKMVNEDPCVLLRKNLYDFIYLNCKTKTSQYLDSVFSNIKENTILVITTSEDPSLYWQTAEIALRNYGGIIAKTSYHREVSVRLILAEMARAAARYQKALQVECTIAYKSQQSCTIVTKIIKGIIKSKECIQNIKLLAHCNLCEDRNFILNSIFIDKVNINMNCNCSKDSEGKVIIGIGPLWAGDIFNVRFIESLIQSLKMFPWEVRISRLLKLILEEAKCFEIKEEDPPHKKKKLDSVGYGTKSMPYFYINTHRHNAKELKLLKLSRLVNLLQKNGFQASRTHFDSEAVRTNASVIECINILRQNSNE